MEKKVENKEVKQEKPKRCCRKSADKKEDKKG